MTSIVARGMAMAHLAKQGDQREQAFAARDRIGSHPTASPALPSATDFVAATTFPEKSPTPPRRETYDNRQGGGQAMRKPADSGLDRAGRARKEGLSTDSRVIREGRHETKDARSEDLGDARLVERACEGDDQAFAALVVRYERKLIRVLTRLVRDEELARDLAQETFWKVYNRLDRFDTARRFGPWLFRIGVNLGLDQLRRNNGLPAASIDRPVNDEQRAFDVPDADPRIQAELAQEVQFILERIPIPYRTILVLRDLEGFSSAEVAAIAGRREATVRWRLAKAREMFREHWERRQELARQEKS